MSVKSLGYVTIETANPAEWDRFLVQVVGAMRAPEAADGAALYRLDERLFRFRIEQGARERLVAAGYEVEDAAALDLLAGAIRAAGRPMVPVDADAAGVRGAAGMIRTSDPAGNPIEFFYGDRRAETPFVSPAGVPHFITGALGMGHAVLSAPNFDATVAFYCDVIGLGKTDMPRFYFNGGPPDDAGVGFAFLHAGGGRHHSLAVGEGPVPPSGCVHLMVELPNLTEVGKAHDRMRREGFAETATLGRHVNDETTGFYVQTPAGFDLEIGCEGLVIDPAQWVTTQHEQISIWGHVWAWQQAAGKAGE